MPIDRDPRVNVLGVGVHATNMDRATSFLLDAARDRLGGYVCVTGVHGVMESQRDESLRVLQNHSLLTVPDGMPMTWVGRLRGHKRMNRVYGPALMLRIFDESAALGLTHFLLGGGQGVVEALADAMRSRNPSTRILGLHTPPFRPLSDAEESALVDELKRLAPSYCWVGLSTPKQERLAARLSRLVPGTVFLAVGAAFDLNAGLLRQAPSWMQRSGLEWLFRLGVEPRRLWRRYLGNNPAFVWRIFVQFVTHDRSAKPL